MMTHDEIHDHLATLDTSACWEWVYAQPPAVQSMVLRNMVALGARTAGLTPEDAWMVALQRVPEHGTSPFGGGQPDLEWEAALGQASDAVQPGTVQGWHTNVSGDVSEQGDMLACLRAGASSNTHLVSYFVG